jgi:alpha-1,3-rhamnosyl/mannosyltransferase
MTGVSRPRVGVNLLWLVPGVVGGSEEYTTRLLSGLAERPPSDFEVVLFVNRPFVDAHADLAAAFPRDVAPLTGRSKTMRIWAESTWLWRRARRRQITLMHYAGGTVPPFGRMPSVLTIHDLQPLAMPKGFAVTKRTYLRLRLPPSVRHARLILTPSDAAGRSVVDRLGVDPARVVTVPPGITVGLPADPPLGDVAERYDLDAPFFLYPAITYPHKNHVTLLRAFARVTAQRPDVLLVLTGGAARAEHDVRAESDRLGIADRVRRLGRIPEADVAWLLHHAVALTCPSLYEGFGLPVLEAMAAGCPVLAADRTALPEVVANAGVLLPAEDPQAWTAAMVRMLDDADARDALVQAGFARAAEFSWSAAAERLAGAYRRGLA